MATFARWIAFFLLALASLSSLCEGGCHQDDSVVVKMCQTGLLTGNELFLDANVTIGSNELCSCTFRQTLSGNMFIAPLTGSTAVQCGVEVNFYKTVTSHIYSVYCLTDYVYNDFLEANTEVTFNMTGSGRMNTCINLESLVQNSLLTVECTEKIQVASTVAPPSTTPEPTTKPPSTTQQPSSQPPQPSSPAPQSSSQPPQPSSQPPQPSSQPPQPSSLPPQSSTQPPQPSTQQPQPSTQPPQPSTQPPQPSTQPPQTSAQPTDQPSQSSGSPTGTTTAALEGTTAPYRFPVPEVAGGVAGAIIFIILLVICCTCCTSRRKKERKPDEESLRSRGRESPEMQEKTEGRGYAFDNLLYHASQRDLTGKSVTPTVSDADPQDYQATKGLEELYASVNKTITDSTDIM